MKILTSSLLHFHPPIAAVAACVVSFLTLKDLFRLTITSQSMAPYVLYESCKALQRPVPDNGMIDAHVV